MRFAATIFATLFAASAVFAQDPSAAPPCLLQCSTAPPTSCPDAKDSNAITKCGCEDDAYRANSTACLEVTCTSASEFHDAQVIAVAVCAAQGVDIEPQGTWKGPNSTPTSSDSASTPTGSSTPDNAAFSTAPALVALLGSVALALAL